MVHKKDAPAVEILNKHTSEQWPKATPKAPAPDRADTATSLRSGFCTEWFKAASEFGSSMAAPIPCTARAPCKVAIPGARPHTADAAQKLPHDR